MIAPNTMPTTADKPQQRKETPEERRVRERAAAKRMLAAGGDGNPWAAAEAAAGESQSVLSKSRGQDVGRLLTAGAVILDAQTMTPQEKWADLQKRMLGAMRRLSPSDKEQMTNTMRQTQLELDKLSKEEWAPVLSNAEASYRSISNRGKAERRAAVEKERRNTATRMAEARWGTVGS
mmetsp:Transcript_37318/g.80855  ORF Transcript_37318/g.80855 Transcript_37318/m.80855 type:complete len:178 (-) Transcript_37318:111-644(-)